MCYSKWVHSPRVYDLFTRSGVKYPASHSPDLRVFKNGCKGYGPPLSCPCIVVQKRDKWCFCMVNPKISCRSDSVGYRL